MRTPESRKITSVFVLLILLLGSVVACDNEVYNNPYPKEQASKNIYYASFAERPKTLDPAKAYSSNEYIFLGSIYEPLLQYHYLIRPYQLVPLTSQTLPKITYIDKKGNTLGPNAKANDVAFSIYDIHLKPNIYYQPHPAFAKKGNNYLYYPINEQYLKQNNINRLQDFKHVGTRKLVAQDYAYQIKRLADPKNHSPIAGLMAKYIIGFDALSKELAKDFKNFGLDDYRDLRKYKLPGVEVIDDHHLKIKLRGKYPQFIYWLAMPFFSPIPWEAARFYSQPGMDDHNITLDWYPIGTGPYYLEENNPNRRMLLERNPNFHFELYPSKGMPGDREKGLLKNKGKRLPFIDSIIFSLEKESIPRWNKFIQGYYDSSGITADSFDQAITVDKHNNPILTKELLDKGIRLQVSVAPSVFYLGFNMLDNVVGGDSERARLLRQAISIAINYEEFIAIFFNGRGQAAQGPIPPGIFGFKENSFNPYVYHRDNGKIRRRSIDDAKKLLKRAGYPDGIDKRTGKALLLNYDVPASNGPDDRARFDWFRKQFAKLGIELNIRATQYNRFQEKIRNGNAQIFTWGWHADYPDPENFLFLLYGPNSKVRGGGENAANYSNPEFNRLFEAMKNMHNGPERTLILKKMMNIAQHDAPWVWGIYPKTFSLSHQWRSLGKPNEIGHNVLKYHQVDINKRAKLRNAWNQAVFWPVLLFAILFALSLIPVFIGYWRKVHHPRRLLRK